MILDDLDETSNPTGWSIQIVGRFGERVDPLQLNATESMSCVKGHLERNPDPKVVVTGDRTQPASELQDMLSAGGSTDAKVTAVVDENIREWGESVMVDTILHSA